MRRSRGSTAAGWPGARRPRSSGDLDVLRPVAEPFSDHGGLRLLSGNLGRAIIKTSAMKHEHHVIEAPALVFNDQEEVIAAFQAGKLARDFVAVVRFQGPRANGMPELHALTPSLASLQSKGFRVALVTDGRMSGASGSVPAAIHVTPGVLGRRPLGQGAGRRYHPHGLPHRGAAGESRRAHLAPTRTAGARSCAQ